MADVLGRSLHDIELVWYERPVGQRVPDPQIKNPGEAHLAIAVDDADAWYERLSAAGVRFFSPPNEITAGVNTGGKSCYFWGPDDIVHEILQPPADRIERFLASEAGEGETKGAGS